MLGSLAEILILAALIVFGLFRVQEVVVTGNQSFSAKQIKDAVMKDGMCRNTLYPVSYTHLKQSVFPGNHREW